MLPDPLTIGGVLLRALARLEGCITRRHILRVRSQTFRASIILEPLEGFTPANPEPPLREIEDSILQALGTKTMFAKEIAKEAGYSPSTHFRDALRKLVSDGRLEKTDRGYRTDSRQ